MAAEQSLPTWRLLLIALVVVAAGAVVTRTARRPGLADAELFMKETEAELRELGIKSSRASWVQETNITDDTELLSAEASKQVNMAQLRRAQEAQKFSHLDLPPDLARKFMLLRLTSSAPPPSDTAGAAELATILSSLSGDYGKGTYCRPSANPNGPPECRQLGELSKVLATSRNPAELLDAWTGWHAVGAPMRERYTRFAELANQGATTLGFTDVGAMWRSGYDMPPEAFEADMDRLWEEVKPLYVQLHAYVRSRLVAKYGASLVPPTGPIPAHLLGNMWAQDWSNIYDLLAPPGARATAGDISPLLVSRKVDAKSMVKFGEGFFTSLGFDSLPSSFWSNSQFTKPRDREVVCHASAWDIDTKTDLRIKMCIEPTMEDFVTIHHELGHNFYQRAYMEQPFLFQNGANDGFHEAIGDAIALGITPAYLKEVGLDAGAPDDLALLMRQGIDRVAFLPFGLLVDKWRWQVFDGRLKPDQYNAGWWELRTKYQGVAAPVARTEADFDPGAKFHIPGNTPYSRYFLAQILQFQFYQAMCKAAGYTGPLHRCTFYGSKAAGDKLATMLRLGQSQPWQETLFAMTGSRTIDAHALLEYFAPLQQWLEQQNQGSKVGW